MPFTPDLHSLNSKGVPVRALAVWCFRHRRIVVIGWLLLLVGLFGLSRAVGASYDNSFSLPGADSARASALLKANAPASSGDSEQLVFAAKGGAKLTYLAVRAQAQALLAKVSALPHVTAVVSPLTVIATGTALPLRPAGTRMYTRIVPGGKL